ncbi:deoxyribose-phosphate aldolase [Cuneatibacter sp. NSJ-177]|uniref:deoxyribose-phosphate aldolase n=1 Tax=Cuneatibacter sp. NSJ-177 TaxID=2931401 RepID=UPI001FD0F1C7|nr:deoxyribose-phosphate aldolase [Cuneatibacter sp. NSJ-177]MCJ7835806.1 deoxyribose-phosphate aldolase [Cuneatibacter sp. NSJ-177]
MDKKEVLRKVDHTLLSSTATWQEIQQLCDDAITYETASVCIPPSYVKRVKDYVGNRLRIGTVVGFPNGYSTTSVKAFEADDALKKGADELDMVINLGNVKNGDDTSIYNEIRTLKMLCGQRVLKVIVETCFLTQEEKIRLCRVVTEAGADFIKTSTGFGPGGATFEDVALFAEHVGPGVRIKAAGGIRSFEDAEELIRLGASRLGTSRLVKLMKEKKG